ncbi:MAG: DUF4433 domain-containing protein [Lewinellaceae bacterium]|nr:DUF4433 domain-containing protein [Phaeodactylibacter sp.]MCB9037881.1 DUF4433 domain-containing protein [Lewinellaceae bacterium]
MPGNIPNPIWVFRIVHQDNLKYLLEHGMFSGTHPDRDPNYIFIGDNLLTQQRETFALPIEGAGNIGAYVAFYFCPRSPMLFNIKTGHRGIPQLPQSEILYLCCRVDCLDENGAEWAFTDGHAKNFLTSFYTQRADFDKVDWNLRWEQYWHNTEEDPDRQRRKQAEFLVRHHVPPECIDRIVVYDESSVVYVQEIIAEVDRNVEVYINPQGKFYY